MKTLYISDMDGTLLSPDVVLSEHTVNKLNELIARGVNFSVATARTSATAVLMLKRVNIKVPIVLMNGTCIYDIASRRFLRAESLPATARAALLEALCRHGLSGFIYTVEDGELHSYYEKFDNEGAQRFVKERVEQYNKTFTKVDSFSLLADKNIIYFSIADSLAKVKPVMDELAKRDDLHIEFYHDIYIDDYWFFEVCSPLASKKLAVDFLREYGGYDRIVGFGDNLNDLPLFEACDVACAVSNAKPEPKAAADFIIGSNAQDGVVKWIEEDFNNG